MKPFYLFFLLLSISCSSLQHSSLYYNCHQKYRKALRKVSKGKEVATYKPALVESVDCLLAEQSAAIKRWMQSRDVGQYKKALKANLRMQEQLGSIQSHTDDLFDEVLVQVRAEELSIRQDIALLYYEEGLGYLQESYLTEDKALAEKAYHRLQKAKKAGVTVTGLDATITEAFAYAQRHILVRTSSQSNSWDIRRKFEHLEWQGSKFVHYYVNEWTARDYDCVVDLVFNNPSIWIEENRQSDTYSKEIEDGYTTETDSCGNDIKIPIHKTVEARVTTTRYVKYAEWGLQVYTQGSSKNCISSCSGSRQRREYVAERIRIRGDERALPGNISEKDNRSSLPSNDRIIDDMLDDMYSEVCACF